MKRGQVGGPIVLHQDHPYWVGLSDDLDRIITAMVALDDSTLDRGPLEVVPGSHKEGVIAGKETDDAFERNEIDASRYDTSRLVPVPVPAGSAILFGARLVHRSAPNRSPHDRRAMLYTYQPAPARHAREVLGLEAAPTAT